MVDIFFPWGRNAEDNFASLRVFVFIFLNLLSMKDFGQQEKTHLEMPIRSG